MAINLSLIGLTWIGLNRTNRRLTVNKLEYKRSKYFFGGRCWFLAGLACLLVQRARTRFTETTIGATCARCSTAFSKSCAFRLSLISLVAERPQRRELVFLGRSQRRLEGFFLSEERECWSDWTIKNISNSDRCFKILEENAPCQSILTILVRQRVSILGCLEISTMCIDSPRAA